MTAKIPPKSAAKPSKDVIYVDVDDEITGIIDKLENSSHKVVALVLPKRATSLQSIVNMKLLARSAETAGKSPVLITSENALLPLAGAAGLHVAKNLQSKPEVPDAPVGRAHVPVKKDDEPEEVEEDGADNDDSEDLPEKIDYSSPVGALAAAHEDETDAAIDLDDEAGDDDAPAPKSPKKSKDKDKKLKVPNFDRFRMLLGLGVLAIIGLIAFAIFAISVLPKAKITIQTTSESVSANFDAAASTDTTAVDSTKNLIPAKLETMDQTGTQQVTATGQQNNGSKATGSVVMSTQVCAPNLSNVPSNVSSGTGISSGGLNYLTQQTATFSHIHPSGSCINYSTDAIDITAQSAGSKYNTSNATFTIAGRPDVSGSGSSTGGTDNIVTILSQADVDGAKDKLTAGTTAATFTKTFEDKLAAQDEYVLVSTLNAGTPSITATPAVGQPASTANVTIKITYTVLALKKTDLSQLIEAKTSDQIDSKKQKLTGNFLNDATLAVQSQGSPNSAQISISEDTTAVPIISIDSVKQQAKGKKAGDIQSTISNWPGVKNVDVSLGPFWVSKVPTKTSKITVVLQEVKASSSDSKP